MSQEERDYAIEKLSKYRSGGGISRYELKSVTRKFMKPFDPISDVHAELIRKELMEKLDDKKDSKAAHEKNKSPFERPHDVPRPNLDIKKPDDKDASRDRDVMPSHLAPPKLTQPKISDLEDLPKKESRRDTIKPLRLKPITPPKLDLPPEAPKAEPPKPTWGQTKHSNANVFRKPPRE